MSLPIELHAYMDLGELFRERGWENPRAVEVDGEISGLDLVRKLDIEVERVEVVFVNGKAYTTDTATIHPGDRVALVPPGVPGPHRFMLGFKKR